jgi:hypothetical protein
LKVEIQPLFPREHPTTEKKPALIAAGNRARQSCLQGYSVEVRAVFDAD